MLANQARWSCPCGQPLKGRGNPASVGPAASGENTMQSEHRDRREFLKSAAALAGAAATANLLGTVTASAAPLPFRFGHTVSARSGLADSLKMTAAKGFPGYEPGRSGMIQYLDKPLEVRKMFQDAGIVMASCSNEGPNFSTDWLDPAKSPQTIKDHVAFARDFIKPVGMSDHFKCVPTRARDLVNGPSDDDLKRMSDAWNEAGRQMIAFGIKFAPHNHVGTSFYLEKEFRRVAQLTDPRYVWFTLDTSHLQLGGMDSARIISEFFPRIAEVHYKDAPAEYRNNGKIMNEKSGIPYFRNLGAGGVDFAAVHKVLIDKRYQGWVCLDIDGGMVEAGGGPDGALQVNKDYLVNVLKVDPDTV